MEEPEKIPDYLLKDKETRLSISRVPKRIKEEFIKLAEEEFEKDYGMCLKWCFEQALEYQSMKPLIFNIQTEKKPASQGEKEEEPKKIRVLSGKELKKEVTNRNG